MDKETLVRMTVLKLKEEALTIEGISGVHGMKKSELLDVLFKHYNIPVEEKVKRDVSGLKKQIVALRARKEEARKAGDKKQLEVLRRRIHAIRRRTRH